MTNLAAIQEELLNTSAELSRLQGAIAQNPGEKALSWGARSLEKRQRKLESELASAADSIGREVCRYRIIPERDQLRIGNIAGVLSEYQSLVTVVFAAIREGAKQTASVSAVLSELTGMDFSYATAGSAVFALTSRADKNLLGESEIDEAVETITSVSGAKNSAEVLSFARRLGPAPIRVLYRWADEHLKGGFSADIVWNRGGDVRNRLLMQLPEFSRLRQAITETSNEEATEISLTGDLNGVDVATKTFHFVASDGTDVRGKYGDAITALLPLPVPSRCKVRLRETTQVRYSTDQTTRHYELLSLDPVHSPTSLDFRS